MPVFFPGARGSGILLWGANSVSAGADTRYFEPGYDSGTLGTAVWEMVVPKTGTLFNLFARHNQAVGNGLPVDYTIVVNGVATALTVSLITNAIGQAGNTGVLVGVSEGDRLAMIAVKVAGIGSGVQRTQVSCSFRES